MACMRQIPKARRPRVANMLTFRCRVCRRFCDIGMAERQAFVKLGTPSINDPKCQGDAVLIRKRFALNTVRVDQSEIKSEVV